MAPPTLKPQKTAVLVAQRIAADIQRRGNKVGDRLPPEKVMLDEYQVGRGTLREALRFLELQGLISLKPGPGGGPVVEQPDGSGLAASLTLLLQFENASFRTILEARAGLEPIMTQLAALRCTEEQLAELKNNLDHMAEANDDEHLFLKLKGEFHDLISKASGNAIFVNLIDALAGILDGAAIGIELPAHRRLAVHKAHERIFDALAAHDPTAAAAAMRVHIDEFTRYAETKFPDALDSPVRWGSR